MKKVFLALFLFHLGRILVCAKTIHGVALPPEKNVSGHTLTLNGAGLRTVFILKIKIYVAAFYCATPLRNPEDVFASPGPLRFDFTFLRSVSQDKVKEAWTAQFNESITHAYTDLSADKTAFINAFGPIRKGGVETVELVNNETRLYDDGNLKGVILGRDFQKAFLSMWFGDKPVAPQLKRELLGLP